MTLRIHQVDASKSEHASGTEIEEVGLMLHVDRGPISSADQGQVKPRDTERSGWVVPEAGREEERE